MTGEVAVDAAESRALIRRIVAAYDHWLVRRYAAIRFQIIHRRLLDAVADHFPSSGKLMDVGCGFGLIALYYGLTRPALQIHAFDFNAGRIEAARAVAKKLGADNVEFHVGDAAQFAWRGDLAGAYFIDLIHHIPPAAVEPLLSGVAGNLAPRGRMIIKDIEPRPFYKMAFTWLLDKAMDYRAPVRYWAPTEIESLLVAQGFGVERRSLPDRLPYPHVLYVARRDAAHADHEHAPAAQA